MKVPRSLIESQKFSPIFSSKLFELSSDHRLVCMALRSLDGNMYSQGNFNYKITSKQHVLRKDFLQTILLGYIDLSFTYIVLQIFNFNSKAFKYICVIGKKYKTNYSIVLFALNLRELAG